MKKLHTLFVISRYWPSIGGAELHTRRLAHQLNKRQKVTVLYFNNSQMDSNEIAVAHSESQDFYDGNVRTIQVAPQGLTRFLLHVFGLTYPYIIFLRPIYHLVLLVFAKRKIEQFSQDVDVIHNVYNGLTSVTKASISIARKRGINVVWTPLTSYSHNQGKAWSSLQFKRLYQQVDSIIALTQFERTWLQQQGVDKSRIKVIPMGPLVEETPCNINFRARYQLQSHPVVLFLGRHVPQKGYQLLLDSMQQVWDKSPQTHFVFIGPQTKASKTFFLKYKDPKVVTIEQLSQSEKTAALAECNLLCVPSINEGLGVVYLEAWHFGKPVIAGDIPILQTIIQHQKDGLLVKPDSRSVADAVVQLITNPEKAQQMGSLGKEKVTKTYQWEFLARSLLNHYQELTVPPKTFNQ